jgi:penicillin-binding protein activator
MKVFNLSFLLISILFGLLSCSSFKAERVDREESDERALEITDKWVQGDTERVIKEIYNGIEAHAGLKKFLQTHGKAPVVFIGEVQNLTSEAYFPINDLNDELLNKISASGDFILVDAAARDNILKEITYQHDGMVDPSTAKNIGKQTGADLIIFGNVFMKPETRKGKTIKQYSINLRMTDIEKGIEVLRTRAKISKYSEQSGSGW